MAVSREDLPDLDPGEFLLGVWPAETARADGTGDRVGWLVLTDRRVLFYRRKGLLGRGAPERPPLFAQRLETIGGVTVRRYVLRVGYGDRIEIPGVAIDEQGFRLNRESSAENVRAEIERAGHARRAELGSTSG